METRDPWLGKIPWRRKWQPTPVFLPGKSCGQRSLAGYSPRGHKRVGHDLATRNNNLSHSIYESNNQFYVKGTVPGLWWLLRKSSYIVVMLTCPPTVTSTSPPCAYPDWWLHALISATSPPPSHGFSPPYCTTLCFAWNQLLLCFSSK